MRLHPTTPNPRSSCLEPGTPPRKQHSLRSVTRSGYWGTHPETVDPVGTSGKQASLAAKNICKSCGLVCFRRVAAGFLLVVVLRHHVACINEGTEAMYRRWHGRIGALDALPDDFVQRVHRSAVYF